jgi:uncharacterized protein YjdB
MKKKTLLIMLLVALFVPLAMNAQTQRLRKNVTRAPRPQLQLEVAGQLQTIEDFQPGKVYHRATVNTRDNVLYSNGFNSQAELSGVSVIDYNEDDFTWGWYNGVGTTGVSGDYALGCESYDFDNEVGIQPDDFIIMPAITLPAGNAQYFASIYAQAYRANDWGTHETMAIYVAPENDEYFHQVGSDFTLSTGSYEYCEVDLSAYAGQTIEIYIRHYNCFDGSYLFVDDFSVFSRVPEEEITIGSGTSTNAYVPTRTQRRYSLTQQIYTATEIGHTDGGNITSVSFYGSRAATRNLDIYMVNTTQSTIASNTAFHPTTSDRVYSGSVSFTANSWTKITFSTPFEYTGGNVVLIVDDNTGSAANQANNFRVFTANNQAIYIHGAQTSTNTNYNPTSTNLSYTAQNSKNQVKFTIEAAPTLVESITASDLSMMAGFSAQIDYTVLPADATNPAVTFTSANTSVATVSASGVVTGVAAGTTTITLTSVSNPEVSTTINVVVEEFVGLIFDFETNPNEEGWTFVDSDGDGFNWEWEDCSETPHNTPFEGEGCLFSASYDNDSQTPLNPDNWAITPAIHILNSPSVVYLYAQGQDASYAAEHFQVYIGTSPDPSSMTAISSEFVATGSYVQYSANIPDTYAGQIVYLAIRHFNVSDMFVLDVDYVVITNAELAPDGILVESIEADDVEVVVGGTANITGLEVLPADATNPAVTYTSNDETIATVENGVVTGIAVGQTTITIAATDGSGVTATINVTVNGIDVTEITADDVEVVTGETATISYTVAPNNATDQSVTFTSADETIATVAAGVVTGVAVGETTITIASVSNPEVTTEITVTVTSNPNAVQFTVNAPANAHPGDVITVDFMLAAPTTGTYTGFTGLDVNLYFETAAFQYNSKANGAVANAVSDIDMGQVSISAPSTNFPNRVKALLSTPANYPVTTEGVVFSATFTVLQDVELGSYTFNAVINEFDYTTGEVGNSTTVDIPYEFTPSTVTIGMLESYNLPITGYGTSNGGYYLIASPIGEVNPEDVTNMLSNSYDLYYFDQDQELEWINYKAGTFNLEPGKGYLYANSNDVTLTFTGAAYSGDGKVTLHYNGDVDFAGWNLVGNPYATQTAYIDRPFYTMSSDGAEIIAAETESIEPMQGVFVIATSDNEEMTFSTTNPNGKSAQLVINLTTNRNSVIDRAIVRFDESNRLPKFQLNPSHTKLYMPVDNKDYAVVNASEMAEMPVNFKAEHNGCYTLRFTPEEVDFSYLHLIDNMTGTDVDLLAYPSYSFNAKSTDYASRFKIVFATTTAVDEQFAYYNDGILVINSDSNATLNVYDVTGRLVDTKNVNGSCQVGFNAVTGVYMIQLVNGNDVKTQKIVVK